MRPMSTFLSAATEPNQPMLRLGERPIGKTLLTARWILAHANDHHCLIPHGELVFEGNTVVYVGKKYLGSVDRRLDFADALISPGLIDLDALSDLDTTILGIDHFPGWAKGRVWPQSYIDRGPYEMYTDSQLAHQKRFAFAQLLLNGITTAAPIASLFYREWGETVQEFEAAIDAAVTTGLRVYLSPAYRSGGLVVHGPNDIRPSFNEERGLQGLNYAEGFIEQHQGSHGDLIRGLLAPDRVETCTSGLLKATFDVAERLDCQVRLHMAQGQLELDVLGRLHGMTAPQWLNKLNLLSDRLIAPHATHAASDDLRLYAEHDVHVVHCPLVSARGGSLLKSFSRLKQLGINVAMGTDTTPPDMLLNMLVGLMTCRIHDETPEHSRCSDFFNAATLGGARALGRSDLGRLQAGAKADIAIFGLDDVVMTPTIDPITTLVAGGSGKVTRAVFVDGRLVMHDGQVGGINVADARSKAQAQFDELITKYPDRSYEHPRPEILFPPSYPLLTS